MSSSEKFGIYSWRYSLLNFSLSLCPTSSSSFPSGHSSTAFAGLTYLSLWMAGKLHIFHTRRGHAAFEWIIFFPMVGATLIAVSRTMDYRHHATDVIAGSLLGFFIALKIYHTYYPHLTHSASHKPWPPRTSHPDALENNDDEEVDIERTPLTPHQRAEEESPSREY